EVEHDGVPAPRILAEDLEGLQTVAAGDDRVAGALEAAAGDGAHGFFVVDEQDVAAAAQRGDAADLRRGLVLHAAIEGREVEPDLGAAVHGALDDDAAAVRADDAERGGEPEAVARLLRGEEGIEDAGERVGRHAGSVVLDFDADVMPGGQRRSAGDPGTLV